MAWRPYLDIQTVQSRQFSERGIPRYAVELSRALLAAGVPVAGLGLNPHLPFPRQLPPELLGASQLTWNTVDSLRHAVEAGPTLYHLVAPFESPDPLSSALPTHTVHGAVPLVVHVYDLAFELMGLLEKGSPAARFYRIRRRLLSSADLLLAISEQTRRDVIEHLGVAPERVRVVGAGSSEFFRPPRPDESPDETLREHLPRITRPFVLTVSSWDVRKNTELLIDAFARLPADTRTALQLVIACKLPPEGLRQWTERARGAGLGADEVVFTGFVSDAVLRALYQQTELFVFPSRYEGFGLPVLEAARCGAPAVVADAPGLQEVIDWEPAVFQPDDPEALTGLMERAVRDTAFGARLLEVASETAERHTWERVARRTAAAYEQLDPPTKHSRRPVPLRVALVGPFPPVRSGVAHYNARVAEHLGARCELDCFVDAGDWDHEHVRHEAPTGRVQAVGPRRPPGSPARWLPARALGRTVDPARYDAVVYAVGNSWFHHDTLARARRFPGIVWFHDVDLTGLYITYAHRLLAHDPPAAVALFREVLARYARRAPDLPIELTDRRWADYDPYRDAGVHFTLELARDAQACIVSSQRARSLLALDAGPEQLLGPIEVLPLAVPDRSDPPERARTPELVALGRQEDAKRPETLLEAVALLAATDSVRLAFVGELRPELRALLERRVSDLGLGDVVDITGYVSDAEYGRRLDRATGAVLLRGAGNAEGSAAVGDALAAGVPVITSIASCRELPSGTVQLVEPDAGAPELAAEIRRLLRDGGHRDQLRQRGHAYARTCSFGHITTSLLEIIEATRAERWRARAKTA